MGVDALAQVHHAVVLAVEIADADLRLLIHHGGVLRQRGQHRIAHEGAVVILTGGAQQEGLVLRVVPVGKDRIFEAAGAVFVPCDDLEGLHVGGAAVLAVQLDAALLGQNLLPVAQEQLHVGLALPVHPEVRALVQRTIGELRQGVGALDHDAPILAGQVVPVGHQRHHARAALVVHVVEVALRVHVGLHVAVPVDAGAQDGGGADADRPGVERGGLIRVGAIQGVIDAAAGRGGELHRERLSAAEQPAPHGILGNLRAAAIAAGAVGGAGRALGEVEAAVLPIDAAVGDAAVLPGQVQRVMDAAVRRGERHGIAALDVQREVRVQIAVQHADRASRQVHAQILTGLDHRAGGELPLAGLGCVVGQAVAAQIHRLTAAVVDLHPVVLLTAGRSHHFIDIHARRRAEALCVERRRVLMGIGHARRGRHLGAPRAVKVAVGLAVRQRRKLHRRHGLPVGVTQVDTLAGAAQFEVGVQVACAVPAVVAGAVHQQVAARRNLHRREAPLLQLVAGIGEVPALQIHIRIGAVVQLHVVVGLAVFIGAVDRVRAHDLADLHRAALHANLRRAAALIGDFIFAPRRCRAADLPDAVRIPAENLVHAQLRRGHAVDGRALSVEQHHAVPAGGGEPEGRAQRFAGGRRIGALGVDHQILARRDAHVREDENLVDVGLHQQRILGEIDGRAAAVHNLDPVRRVAGIAEQRGAVLGHDFAELNGALRRLAGSRAAVQQRAPLQQVARHDGDHADAGDQRNHQRTLTLPLAKPERVPP